MPKYMLILHRSPDAYDDLAQEQMIETVQKYQAWVENIRASRRYVSSEKLQEEGGKMVELKNGKVSAFDGPYAETKEVIGGYFTIRAASDDEAIEIVRDCPFLSLGRIAIRETDPMGCGGE